MERRVVVNGHEGGLTRLRNSWTARILGTLGIGTAAWLGTNQSASASAPVSSVMSNSSVTYCPPIPSDDAPQSEKETYAVAKYMGCEDLPPPPWSVNNCGIVTCSTYYSRHAVQVINVMNHNSEYQKIFQLAGIERACDAILEASEVPGTAWWCASAGVSLEVFNLISASTFAEAAEQDTCVKETFNPITNAMSWSATGAGNSHCLA